MKLNTQGKRRLLILCVLGLANITLWTILSVQQLLDSTSSIIAFFIFLPLAFLVNWFLKLRHQIEKNIFKLIGFHWVAEHGDISELYIAQHENLSNISYYQKQQQHPFKIVRFKTTRRSGKHTQILTFIGFEFKTNQSHPEVQIRSSASLIKPLHSPLRQLESTEFSKLFKVYAKEAPAPFYFLDPDSMSDLIDLRQKYHLSINLDASGHTILIFIPEYALTALFRWPTPVELLNGEVSSKKMEQLQGAVTQLLDKIQTVFNALDYKTL